MDNVQTIAEEKIIERKINYILFTEKILKNFLYLKTVTDEIELSENDISLLEDDVLERLMIEDECKSVRTLSFERIEKARIKTKTEVYYITEILKKYVKNLEKILKKNNLTKTEITNQKIKIKILEFKYYKANYTDNEIILMLKTSKKRYKTLEQELIKEIAVLFFGFNAII